MYFGTLLQTNNQLTQLIGGTEDKNKSSAMLGNSIDFANYFSPEERYLKVKKNQ